MLISCDELRNKQIRLGYQTKWHKVTLKVKKLNDESQDKTNLQKHQQLPTEPLKSPQKFLHISLQKASTRNNFHHLISRWLLNFNLILLYCTASMLLTTCLLGNFFSGLLLMVILVAMMMTKKFLLNILMNYF